MNRSEHLLVCLSEECLEVAKDISKALRFGLEDQNVQNPHGPTNRSRIMQELNDLMAVISMAEDAGILPKEWRHSRSQADKKLKVLKFMDYAKAKGALK